MDSKEETPRRLCSEIQLFDLCTKKSCEHKDGRYCTDNAILGKFEAIRDDEDANLDDQYLTDEMDELEEDDLQYDEGIGIEQYDEEESDEDET